MQSVVGTGLASLPGPSWVGMRPTRPLQDVREGKRQVRAFPNCGYLPGRTCIPAYLPARRGQVWRASGRGRKGKRSSFLAQLVLVGRDLLLPSETSRQGEVSGSASAALQDLAWTTLADPVSALCPGRLHAIARHTLSFVPG